MKEFEVVPTSGALAKVLGGLVVLFAAGLAALAIATRVWALFVGVPLLLAIPAYAIALGRGSARRFDARGVTTRGGATFVWTDYRGARKVEAGRGFHYELVFGDKAVAIYPGDAANRQELDALVEAFLAGRNPFL